LSETRITAARRRKLAALHDPLNGLYLRYNQRAFVDPDPLVPLYAYADPRDQEIVGLITASLAFGNVKQILKSIDLVLRAFPEPARTLPGLSQDVLNARLAGFRHRYVTGVEMASLLTGVGTILREHGSIGACFAALDDPEGPTLLPTLIRFVHLLRSQGTIEKNYLLPDPALGSACKRWFMFLRWMVRKDDVDLGLWSGLGAHRLIVPVDTHMHRVALGLGLTRRRMADLKTALEITQAFQVVCPEDPVRYDFCLTRLGIRDDGDMDAFLRETRILTKLTPAP
jgi:uncharacterized protein (TIGR02757 family)